MAHEPRHGKPGREGSKKTKKRSSFIDRKRAARFRSYYGL
jgi:hypothetical protein